MCPGPPRCKINFCVNFAFSDKIQSIKQGFESSGFAPEVKPLAFFQDDYGLGPIEGEDDATDEEEDVGENEDGEHDEEDEASR